MCQLVDQNELGRSLEDDREVHFLQLRAAVLDGAAGQRLEALRLGDRLRAPVRLQVADHDITPRGLSDRPSWSMRYVLPTPAAMPRKILW